MRTFEIVDGERPGVPPCATLRCDQGRGAFSATVADWAGPNDVPVQFSPFIAKGEREIPERWVEAWVEERIAPPSRQNIGEILRAHGLDRYDPCELLVSGEGRSTQDGYYLRETTEGYRGAALLGRRLAQERARAGLSQQELAERSGVRQETISRIERGRANPTLATLDALAQAMDIEVTVEFDGRR